MSSTHLHTNFHSIREFQFLDETTLGKGSFGTVVLALHLKTNKIYAVKIVQLTNISTEIGVKALQREMLIHQKLDHPHIVKLWQIFEENNKIYFILEYIENGNLFYYQNSRRIFSEVEASIFFSQTLSAIEYLHTHNYMHRDIKPQNLLLDKEYNIKICDFGWIVGDIYEKRKIFCGTYEYMAPEMIFDQEYDYRIDIWALGILLYQLLHGFAPFQGETVAEVRQEMLKGQIQLDPRLSEDVQDLIYNILKLNPCDRLSIDEIKDHEWMKTQQNIRFKKLKGLCPLQNKKKSQKIINSKVESEDKEESCQTKRKKDNKSPPKLQQGKRNQKIHDSIDNIESLSKVKGHDRQFVKCEPARQKNVENWLSTKKQKNLLKKQLTKSNKENQISLKNNAKPKKILMAKKRSVGAIKFNHFDNSHTINWHRPQNSDILVYENTAKIKKQSRLKTEENGLQANGLCKTDNNYQVSSSKVLTRFQTEVNDTLDIQANKRREKIGSKSKKYKKNYIPKTKIMQFLKPNCEEKVKNKNSFKMYRKSID